MDTRRKILFYINPANSQADQFASLALDSVVQGERGRLQRASMLAGLALHKIDPRLPFLLSELLTETTTEAERSEERRVGTEGRARWSSHP